MKENDKYSEAKIVADALKDKARGCDTSEEVIKEWLQQNQYAKEAMEKLADKEYLSEMFHAYKCIKEESTNEIERLICHLKTRERRRRVLFASSLAAALIALSLLVYNVSPDKEEEIVAWLPVQQESMNNKPHLILGNGKTIDVIASTSHPSEIEKILDPTSLQLNYSTIPISQDTIEYHTLITPSAYTYSLILADGSEVTLNANSKLRYPVKFTHHSREVFLEGEAYFKVNRDRKPFVVHSAGVRTKVYGTEFNIQSFGDETVKTVLVAGSVGVKFKEGTPEKMLKPNQMTTVDTDNGNIQVTDVDVRQYTAWLTGHFRYDSQKIGEAIDEFSRWYGVEFEFTNPKDRDAMITALFEKRSSLETIILTIEKATTLKFIKKGGSYIIE